MKSKFNPWPYAIILFFVLLLCAMTVVLVICATHRETMVSENYYEQELKFQDQIDNTTRAEKSGASIRMDAATTKLLLAVPPTQLAERFSGTIEFYRPSSPDLDRTLSFTPDNDGSQALDVSKFTSGLWLVRVKWTAGGLGYYLEQKITI